MSDNHSHDNYPPGFDPRVLDNDEILLPDDSDEDDDLADEFLGEEDEYVPEELL